MPTTLPLCAGIALGLPVTHSPDDIALAAADPARWAGRLARRGRALDEHVVLILHTWTYAGTGYTTTPGAELALASAAMARAHRQAATAA